MHFRIGETIEGLTLGEVQRRCNATGGFLNLETGQIIYIEVGIDEGLKKVKHVGVPK